MITVAQILQKKPVIYNVIAPDELIIDALTMLNSLNLSYLVVKEGEEYKGIFCERDYCRNVVLRGRSSRENLVGDVMSVDIPIVQVTDTAEYCMVIMNLYKTRYLLAYNDEEELQGVITIHDLLRAVLMNREFVFDHHLADLLITNDEGGKIY